MKRSARQPARNLVRRDQWLQLSATLLFAAALAILLALGMGAAGRLQAASSALQSAAQLSGQPQLISADLTLIEHGLETTTYVGTSLRAIADLRSSTAHTLEAVQGEVQDAGLQSDRDIAGALSAVRRRWSQLDKQLAPVRSERGAELYTDTPAGSQLSAQGRAMKGTVDALLATQTQNLQQLGAGTSRLDAVLRDAVTDAGLRLRALLLAGSAVAALLLALMLYFGWRSRQAARQAEAAQRQVSNILGTVREGLFLLDRELCLGNTFSESLCELLRLSAPAGLHIEEILKPLVDAKTLTAALKFLGLLWKDKVHEELIESVNPLNQIEISFSNGRGGNEVRYLAFSFRRVRAAEAAGDYILGVVADVTDRVLLARELETVKAESDSQATLQLQLLRVDNEPLRSFLAAADVALRKSNAVLNASGIEQEDLKKKLNGVFRELHAVKGEAAALSLSSFVQRIHSIEDALAALRQRPTLSGNDFLPIVVRLDELLNHLGQIRTMQERVATLRALRSGEGEERGDDSHRDTMVLSERPRLAAEPTAAGPPPAPPAAPRGHPLIDLLRTLTQEVARSQNRRAQLRVHGFTDLPPRIAGVVKDICIQMIRNSVSHGIELPEERTRLGKPEEGTVQISFDAQAPEDFVLTVEDDGRGLSYEQIIDKALRLDLISPQQAVSLERAAVYRLIFQPGFSTTEEVSEHAGRGVGLDAVSTLVREHGGRIGVSTASGRYTRFRVLLPRNGAMSASSAA
ncbi:MAG TPA: ATP-binding protein [Steroidobacteraceae bacterium]|nr:ATP-binding protein [Steroidobacteraceae bacterium]